MKSLVTCFEAVDVDATFAENARRRHNETSSSATLSSRKCLNVFRGYAITSVFRFLQKKEADQLNPIISSDALSLTYGLVCVADRRDDILQFPIALISNRGFHLSSVSLLFKFKGSNHLRYLFYCGYSSQGSLCSMGVVGISVCLAPVAFFFSILNTVKRKERGSLHSWHVS